MRREGEEQANSERVREFSAQNCQSGKLTHKKKKKVEGEGEHTILGTAGERAGEQAGEQFNGRRSRLRVSVALPLSLPLPSCTCIPAALDGAAAARALLCPQRPLSILTLSLSLFACSCCRISAARGKLLNSCERQLHKLTYSLSLPLHICLNLLWRDEIAKQTM